MTDTRDAVQSTSNHVQVSTGAAIILSVIWTLMTGLTCGIIYFMWLQPMDTKLSEGAGFVLFAITIAPLITAYVITKKILDLKD